MTIKNIILDLGKKVRIYEIKKEDKDKSKLVIDNSKFSDDQKKLENELLRLKSEKNKEDSKTALETIVLNGQISEWKGFEEIEKQHFEKQFEGIKAIYKTHEIINPNLADGEKKNQDAYDSSHQNQSGMNNHYQSDNSKKIYHSHNNDGY